MMLIQAYLFDVEQMTMLFFGHFLLYLFARLNVAASTTRQRNDSGKAIVDAVKIDSANFGVLGLSIKVAALALPIYPVLFLTVWRTTKNDCSFITLAIINCQKHALKPGSGPNGVLFPLFRVSVCVGILYITRKIIAY